jgi:hypothetical protein
MYFLRKGISNVWLALNAQRPVPNAKATRQVAVAALSVKHLALGMINLPNILTIILD